MRAVLSRVRSGYVSVAAAELGDESATLRPDPAEPDRVIVGELPAPGLLALVGTTHSDTEADAAKIARKIWGLRILKAEQSASDLGAPILIVSQFTLYGDARKGRRPSWSNASPGSHSEPLIAHLVELLRAEGAHVETGRFGAMMHVASVGDGPFTVLLDSVDLA